MVKGRAPLKAKVAIAALLLLLASCADFDLYSMMQGEIPGGPLEIIPVSALLQLGVTFTFRARGGSPPYSFAVIPHPGSGSIDSGSGLYTAPPFPSNDTIQVQDSKGATSLATVAIN